MDTNIFELHDIETDITINSNIRKLFFEQLNNRDFNCDFIDDDILVKLNLFLPENSEYPFSFRIDTKDLIIIPQYTKTHRAYIPDEDEKKIIKSTISYVYDYKAHPKRTFYKKIEEPKNKFVGKFSGIKSRKDNKILMSYDLPKSFNDLEPSIFLDSSNDSSIKNIFVYNIANNKENIAFIKIFESNQYRILINPDYESIFDIDITFKEDSIKLELLLDDSIDADSISLICKG